MDWRTTIGIGLVGFLLADELSAGLGTDDAKPVNASRKAAHPYAGRRVDTTSRRVDYGEIRRFAIALLNGVNRLAHAHQALQLIGLQDQDAHFLMPHS